MLVTEPFFRIPCDSKDLLSMCTFTKSSPVIVKKLLATKIKRKCLKLKHLDTYIIIPLLHAHN